MILPSKQLENSDNLIDFLQGELEKQASENKKLLSEVESLKKQNDWLKEQIGLNKQRQYGKSSESTASMNLTLFDEAMDAKQTDESVESSQSDVITYTRRKKSTGRKFDISQFPKEQYVYDLTEDEKTCACGHTLEKMGEDSSIQVDHIPETFKVIEHIAIKYCCRQCDTVKSAKKPETAIPKCMATPGFVAEVITKKYEQHLPLYRQSKLFARLGADIPDNTLGNWVMRAADALEPLREAYQLQIIHSHVMQADETKVKTIKPNKQGYFWGYHGCDPGNRFILFEYSPSRGAHVPNKTLKDFAGILQTDGYSGYNELRAKSTIINVGCWDHCRRKFTEVVKVADKSKQGKAAQLILLMNKLYDIEREARKMAFAERKAYRQAHAKPVLDSIYNEANHINAPPKSLLGSAVTYLINQWSYLQEYVNHGEVPISNCWIENQIRPFALGRRNWLFTGTPESANKAALLYSLIQTCNMNNIVARRYLEYVINQAHAMRRGNINPTSLLPQFIDQSLFVR